MSACDTLKEAHMDRMIHTALNSIMNISDIRTTMAQNLANMSVPGFRRELPNEGSSAFMLDDGKLSSRAFALELGPSTFSEAQGSINTSDLQTDVAIVNEAYFIIDPGDRDYAFSRRGDLKVNVDGQLIDGSGSLIMSNDMQPIDIPAYREIQITPAGEIIVSPLGAEQGQFVTVGNIGTSTPHGELMKGLDSLIRYKNGDQITTDQTGKIQQGALESSNVNPVNELVQSLEMQRQFEINLKLISAAKDIDEGGASLLRIPQQ